MIELLPIHRVPSLLGVPNLSLSRVRRLLALVRMSTAPIRGGRGKDDVVTVDEVVALRAAFILAGGEDALLPGRRLRSAKLRRVIRRFAEQYGVATPLSVVRFQRFDRTIVAFLDGVRLDPETGQGLLDFAALEGAPKELVELLPELQRRSAGAVVALPSAPRALPILVPRSWNRGAR